MNTVEVHDLVVLILSRRPRSMRRIQRLVNRLSFAPAPVAGIIRQMVRTGDVIEQEGAYRLA